MNALEIHALLLGLKFRRMVYAWHQLKVYLWVGVQEQNRHPASNVEHEGLEGCHHYCCS